MAYNSSRTGRASTRERREAIFREAAAIVETAYAEPLTVDDLARRVASSPRQLRRAFREAGDTSFREFVASVRMARAGTDLPVADIGRAVGYREPSRFSKAFKRAYGMNPGAYRRSRRPAG